MLSPTLLYLLKANGALLLFALAYFGLLRRLTFFTLNRFYLVFALLFSAVYPLLPVPALLPPVAAAPVAVVLLSLPAAQATAATGPALTPIDWNAVALAVYGAGVAVGLGRLLMQLLSLRRLQRLSRPAVVQGVAVRALPGNVSPFSFGPSIYLNPEQHPAPELAAVLRHEQVHVRQGHTLDVLLAHVAVAAAWCNPAAWLLRRALLDNLEFLADQAALQTGLDRRAYQYSLLRLSHGTAGPSLVSHFTFPTLKNRVAMMNKPLSSTGQLARYFVAGPLVLAATLGFSGARAQGAGPAVPAAVAATTVPTASTANAPAHRASVSTPTKTVAAVDPADHQLPDGIKAYIAKTYPGSSVGGWFISDKASEKVPHVKYYASITASNGEKHKLYFNASEQLVAAPTPRAATATAELAPQGIKPLGQAKVPPIIYLDGQRFAGSMNDVGPENIANISVFKGDKARQLFGADAGNGVVAVTTKTNQNSAAVTAFNEKLGEGTPAAVPPAAPAQAATSVPYLAAPALAYIIQHYPAARLLGVTELKDANGGPSRYQAEIVLGRRPGYLTFDGAGKFLSESFNR